jgi:hypothetical protein
MILSAAIVRSTSAAVLSGFVEFTTPGTQSITAAMIPSGITRIRVHVVGGGAGATTNGGLSSFNANGVSVMCSGGNKSTTTGIGGIGGGVTGTAGYATVTSGGQGGGDAFVNGGTGSQGPRNVTTYGASMGGGGGGGQFSEFCSCYGTSVAGGGGGGAGRTAGGLGAYFGHFDFRSNTMGGAGGGYGVDTVPVLVNYGSGANGATNGDGGGGGGYAYFTMTISAATLYSNAVVVGSSTGGQPGYVRIEWGPSIT